MNTYEECRQCKLKMNAYKRKLNRRVIILVCGTLIIAPITTVVSMSIAEKAAEGQIHSLLQSQRETLEQIYSEQSKELYNDDFFAPEYISMSLPVNADGSFKSYMDYRKITNKASKQWNLQQLAVTDEFGMRRFNGNYLVAVGTYYADSVGKEFKVTLDSGIVFYAMVGDIKQDKDTDKNNQYHIKSGNIIEFIVDTDILDPTIKKSGNVSKLGLDGAIVKIEEVIRW